MKAVHTIDTFQAFSDTIYPYILEVVIRFSYDAVVVVGVKNIC